MTAMGTFLSLDNGDGPELDGLLGYPRRMARVHHTSDVLVAVGCLFHHEFGGRNADADAWGHTFRKLIRFIKIFFLCGISTY